MLQNALNTFLFAFNITAPIFVMLFLGIWLKKRSMINDEFIKSASQLVYNIGLPVMLFITSATTDLSHITDWNLLIAFGLMTVLVFIGSLLTAHWHCKDPRDHGVFIQGAFRGNLVILGLAFCANAYGEKGLALASLPVAMTVVLYNVLSVYVLNRSLHHASNSFMPTLIGIVKNPLIIAIFAGFAVNAINLTPPNLVMDSGKYLSQMVLPLALICIGGSLSMERLTRIDTTTLSACLWKLILSPIIACTIAIGFGLRGDALAILFLLAASPTATISFVMVQAMKGNGELAANIVAQTTLWSLITVTLGLWVLQIMNFV
ncbi:MAG: AEC family transporter [Cellvibrio sp.]|uniref:AEC family transporter n=1 Tax=Cellvibrio sp. TaxID=1965322 RepID=UPI0027253043|nr:AEC family transporter [Cellvibrio sp.]